jgi:putative FmdB family regulatory protein
MPIYQYECRKCKNEIEIQQSFNAEAEVLCPNCKTNSLFRVVTGGLGFFFASRTLGVVADKHGDKFSEDFKSHLKNKNKTKKIDKLSKKLPKNAKLINDQNNNNLDKQLTKKIQKASPEQLNKYIETGNI